MPAADFAGAFDALKSVFAPYEPRLIVKANTDKEYMLLTKRPSPFKQHKGEPLYFGGVRQGKAYVSFHFFPLYMCPELAARVGPALKKRMQGKSCFNFKAAPDPELLANLRDLAEAGIDQWTRREWV